tara:strand:+ start:136 stop:411 length:276 start_codon:yes stop_codon:yes gene_type:complete
MANKSIKKAFKKHTVKPAKKAVKKAVKFVKGGGVVGAVVRKVKSASTKRKIKKSKPKKLKIRRALSSKLSKPKKKKVSAKKTYSGKKGRQV